MQNKMSFFLLYMSFLRKGQFGEWNYFCAPDVPYYSGQVTAEMRLPAVKFGRKGVKEDGKHIDSSGFLDYGWTRTRH